MIESCLFLSISLSWKVWKLQKSKFYSSNKKETLTWHLFYLQLIVKRTRPVTASGTVMPAKDLQSRKARPPMDVTDSRIVMPVKDSQFRKATNGAKTNKYTQNPHNQKQETKQKHQRCTSNAKAMKRGQTCCSTKFSSQFFLAQNAGARYPRTFCLALMPYGSCQSWLSLTFAMRVQD